MAGISSGANSTSTTGPMTRTTRPMPPSSAVPVSDCSVVAVIVLSLPVLMVDSF